MTAKKNTFLKAIITIALFFAVILFHTSEIIDISIKNATPMLLLSLLTAFSFYSSMYASVIAGLISGALIDSVAQSGYCFNTIIMLVIAVAVNVIANTLFNKNIFAAFALSLLVCALYYIALWLCFHLINRTMEDSLIYLFSYALPSAVYSSVFILPFYYFYKFLN